MRYPGIDARSSASTWCLVDEAGEVLDRGRVEITIPALGVLSDGPLEEDSKLDAAVSSSAGLASCDLDP